MKCPECGYEMKEYATKFKCRNDTCEFEYGRYFHADEEIRNLTDQIVDYKNQVDILKLKIDSTKSDGLEMLSALGEQIKIINRELIGLEFANKHLIENREALKKIISGQKEEIDRQSTQIDSLLDRLISAVTTSTYFIVQKKADPHLFYSFSMQCWCDETECTRFADNSSAGNMCMSVFIEAEMDKDVRVVQREHN